MSTQPSFLNRMKQAGFRRIDWLILAVMLGYVAFMVSEISNGVTLEKGVLLAILSYYMIRIGYEFTLNRGHIPTINTDPGLMRKMVERIKQDSLQKSGTYQVIDCGSGTGKLTRLIAKAVPAAKVLGLEMAKWPFEQSRLMQRVMGIQNLQYLQQDFFAQDYSNTNAVVVFLNARVTEAIGERLYAQLKPGALVITNEFELKGQWPAPEIITMYTPFKGTLYVYRR